MRTLLERFEAKYVPEPNSGCWLWVGCINSDGYGSLGVGRPSRKSVGAHRASWELHKGQIPDGRHVLHRCDMRCCVNPDHLFLGTHQQNIADCKAKGRTYRACGNRQWKAKLTDEQVREIRASKLTCQALAAVYKVTFSTISAARRHHTWKHVT